MNQNAEEMLSTVFTYEGFKKAIPELNHYFLDSFGSYERIDYGTGHELNFILFLLCLFKLRVLSEESLPSVVLHVFNKYLYIARKLQLTYLLEPAGSHGVYGLDDFQHIAFIVGAAQLIKHERYLFIHSTILVTQQKASTILKS